MKKIKIKVNGKFKTILNNYKLSDLLNNLNIPIKKVAIELNEEIIDKRRTSNKKLKKMGETLLYHQLNALINWMIIAVIIIYLIQCIYIAISIAISSFINKYCNRPRHKKMDKPYLHVE